MSSDHPRTAFTTERLLLIPATADSARAAANDDRAALARLLGASIPPEWPPELLRHALPHTADLIEARPEMVGWWMYFFVERGGPTLIGSGGYKGPPDAEGVVEIGYGLLPAWEGRGLATEAARELVRRAFADPRVRAVAAETLPHLAGSIRVMEKCGMIFERRTPARGEEPEIVRYSVPRSRLPA